MSNESPKKQVMEPGIDTGTGTGEYTGLTGPKICCPICKWEPASKDVWACHCGHEWNTFDTGGVCPSCTQQHMITQCLKCNGLSAHSDWYNY